MVYAFESKKPLLVVEIPAKEKGEKSREVRFVGNELYTSEEEVAKYLQSLPMFGKPEHFWLVKTYADNEKPQRGRPRKQYTVVSGARPA